MLKKIIYFLVIAIYTLGTATYAHANTGNASSSLEPIVVTPWRVEELVSNVSKNISIISTP